MTSLITCSERSFTTSTCYISDYYGYLPDLKPIQKPSFDKKRWLYNECESNRNRDLIAL